MAIKIISNEPLLRRLARLDEGRFSSSNPTTYRYNSPELERFLSEEAAIWYQGSVEVGIARAFSGRGQLSKKALREIEKAASEVSAHDVYDEEDRIRHNIVALVNMMRKEMKLEEAKAAVHRAATSFDIIDTANALRYKDAFNDVIIPDAKKLLKAWISIVEREHETLQIGRTHLQHAEPVTFGFSMAWFVDRFGSNLLELKRAVNSLKGKFSGATGSYDALSMFVSDPMAFEIEVLQELGLFPGGISTQIVQPEPVINLVHQSILGFGIISNWANDMRNLMRPEIREVGLPRGRDVSRSSTMPNKQNPVGWENIVSLWKRLMPSIVTMYLDQNSENQRDLTNSASQRYTAELFDIYDYAIRRATGIAEKLIVNRDGMRRNFELSKGYVIAEPLQLLLASLGRHTAHEEVGRLSDKANAESRSLLEVVREDAELRPYVEKLTPGQIEMLSNPERYTGRSSEKALEVAARWRDELERI